MSNVNKVKLLSKRTCGVPPIIFNMSIVLYHNLNSVSGCQKYSIASFPLLLGPKECFGRYSWAFQDQLLWIHFQWPLMVDKMENAWNHLFWSRLDFHFTFAMPKHTDLWKCQNRNKLVFQRESWDLNNCFCKFPRFVPNQNTARLIATKSTHPLWCVWDTSRKGNVT